MYLSRFWSLFWCLPRSLLLFITLNHKAYNCQVFFLFATSYMKPDPPSLMNFLIFRYQLVDFRVRYRKDGSRDSIAPLRTTELRTLPVQQQRHRVSILFHFSFPIIHVSVLPNG